MPRKNATNRAGFTLTELAIVMGIMGVITSAIWWAAGNARESQKNNDAFNEMQTVVQNIDTLMAGRTFSGTTNTSITAALITSQTIPSTYVNNSTTPATANNPWAASGFVVYSMGSLGPRNFRVSFYSVSDQGCIGLLLNATSCQAGQSGCPTGVFTAAGASPYLSPTAGAGWQGVMNPAEATTLCALNNYTGTGINSVEFDYSL